MIIDTHVHISLFENNAIDLNGAFSALLGDMTKYKIDYAFVIPDNLENLSSVADLDKAISLINGNDKFYLLGSPQIIQRGASEIAKYEKLIKEKKIWGIKFFPGHDPYYPTDDNCKPYYELCEKLCVPVIFHTGENSGNSECAKWNDPKYIVEIAKIYPSLKVVIAHYFWPKMDYCYRITRDIPNLYFDIAAMADEEVVEKSGGVEKIKNILNKTIKDDHEKVVFGTDWPMGKTEKHIDLIKSLNLGASIEDRIFFRNAISLYKLEI
jgi:uncharacterized protein